MVLGLDRVPVWLRLPEHLGRWNKRSRSSIKVDLTRYAQQREAFKTAAAVKKRQASLLRPLA